VLEQYPKDVKLVFKHFPLGNHKFAGPAALSSLAANDQGKFWEFHDLVFANYNKLSSEKIRELAEAAGLDMTRYDRDLKDKVREYTALVQRDFREGQRNGVRGTPSIFVNGRLLKQRSLPGFKAMIEQTISRKK